MKKLNVYWGFRKNKDIIHDYGKYTILEYIEDYLSSVWYRIECTYDIWTKGWSDGFVYNMCDNLTVKLLPILKYYRNNYVSIPCDITTEKYEEDLDKIILAFELMNADDYECGDDWEAKQKIIDEGLILFAKHYQGMWQ